VLIVLRGSGDIGRGLTSNSSIEAAHGKRTAIRSLHVIPGGSRDASYDFARRDALALKTVGVDVRLFVLVSRTSLPSLLRDYWHLRREIRAWSPHLIHAHYGTVTAFLCACATRLPLVLTFQGSDLNGDPSISVLRSKLGHLMSHLAVLRAHHVLCVSEQLRTRLWWRHERISVCPNGVNLRLYCPQPRDEARSRLQWDLRERIVLFNAGGNPKVKNQNLAEAAIQSAAKICGDIRLVILDGTAPPEQIPVLLNAADCLLVTSVSEGSPRLVREALACNLPVVSVRVGDIEQQLRDVAPSALVDADAGQLGAALAKILERRQRSNGRESVRPLATERVADRMGSLYRTVLGNARKKAQLNSALTDPA